MPAGSGYLQQIKRIFSQVQIGACATHQGGGMHFETYDRMPVGSGYLQQIKRVFSQVQIGAYATHQGGGKKYIQGYSRHS